MNVRSLVLLGLLLCLPLVASAQSAVLIGNRLYARQQYEPAIKEYERVGPDDRDYATAIYNIGVCRFELWQTDGAIEAYKRAIKLKGGSYPRASFALAIALEDQNRMVEAKQAYLQSIRTARDEYPWAKFKLGLLEANDGNLDTAVRLFGEAAATSGPHTASSHNNLGVMLARMGRLPEAEKEFDVALRQAGGQFDEATHNLALCRSLQATAEMRFEELTLVTAKFFR
jgi:tetratricopeptide (TPR) repeat protein